jgi:outer membrane protein
MKKIVIIFASVSFFYFNNIGAQTAWTLEECINYAHQNNLQVKRMELDYNRSRNDFNQSKLNMLPSLDAYSQRGFNFGKSIDPETNTYDYVNSTADGYSVSTGLNLFSGFQTINNIAKEKYLFLKSEKDIEKTKNDITLAIAAAYLQILFNRELLEVSKSQYEVTLLQVEKTRKLEEVGNVAKGELYKMQAQAALEKVSVTRAQNNLNLSYLELAQLLDLDTVGTFDIIIPAGLLVADDSLPPPISSVYEQALNLPEIESAKLQLKSLEKNLAISKGSRSPTLSFGAGVGTDYINTSPVDYFDQLDNNLREYMGFRIDIPVFSRGEINRNIANAKISVRDAQIALDQTKQMLYKEIQQAHADALAALEKYRSGVEAVKSNEEAFIYTQQKLDVGLVSSVDYNIAKNDLLRAKSELLQAKYEYIFKTKILDFYSGNPITL